MAETRRPAARKPAAKKTPVTNLVDEFEKVAVEVEETAAKEIDRLEGLTVQQLRDMHKQALDAESEARRLVHVLRQRAANAAVDIDIRAEESVIEAKKALAKAIEWVREIEKKLENEYLDIYGVKKQ